ncbi:hypothetical protein [Deinococcus sp.]|uniref:hypothetical protein n=1 Tax=Deinococcus sp. TaxID=47478 RepID=UPI0025DE8F94|nr:hypothetical protein [Deinococcus sp.]
MFYVLSGAGASGKSTLLPLLRKSRPDVRWHDFDELWTGGGKVERQQLTERWVGRALEHGGPFGLLCQCPLGEILCAPSAERLTGIRHLLLDLGDVERVIRLRIRDGEATQDMLNWAAWLRVHQALPDWHGQDPATLSWPGQTLDLSGLSPEGSAEAVLACL